MLHRIMTVDFLFIGLQEIIRVQTRLAHSVLRAIYHRPGLLISLSFLLIIILRVMNSHAEMSIKVRMWHE